MTFVEILNANNTLPLIWCFECIELTFNCMASNIQMILKINEHHSNFSEWKTEFSITFLFEIFKNILNLKFKIIYIIHIKFITQNDIPLMIKYSEFHTSHFILYFYKITFNDMSSCKSISWVNNLLLYHQVWWFLFRFSFFEFSYFCGFLMPQQF